MSRNEYLMQKTTFNDAALNYFQSQYALKKILHTAGVDFESIESLSLSDTATVEKILEKHFHHLLIYAPHSGIVLFPPKSDNNSQQQQSISGKLVPGSEIKEGDLLLSIGDLSGLRATFDVSEMDIVRIHTGMNVVVTSSAFPAVILNGVVTDVSAQAKEDDTHSGISEFTVGISIPQVSKKDMESIRVGMTAKFKIALQHSAHILLPIQAVSENNGKTWVTVVQSHQLKKVEVKTGYTTPTQIEILSGIKPGDKIQIDDRS
ncbi:MAG: macrolide-specific efflux protein [uncultured bacterium]|nr:MAG: macrolide-specific efflux protein [uncultured bacterium]